MSVLTPEIVPSFISSVEHNRPLLMPCSFHCRSPFATSADGEIEHSTGLPSTAASSSGRRYRQTRRLLPERAYPLILPCLVHIRRVRAFTRKWLAASWTVSH